MNKICEYIIYNTNYDILMKKNNSITYYVRLSPEDLISCDPTNNIDIINYITEIVNSFFYRFDYEIQIDYETPMITFKSYIYNFKIKFIKRNDEKLYWILLL